MCGARLAELWPAAAPTGHLVPPVSARRLLTALQTRRWVEGMVTVGQQQGDMSYNEYYEPAYQQQPDYSGYGGDAAAGAGGGYGQFGAGRGGQQAFAGMRGGMKRDYRGAYGGPPGPPAYGAYGGEQGARGRGGWRGGGGGRGGGEFRGRGGGDLGGGRGGFQAPRGGAGGLGQGTTVGLGRGGGGGGYGPPRGRGGYGWGGFPTKEKRFTPPGPTLPPWYHSYDRSVSCNSQI
jgi:hypothetical protein